MPPITKHTNSLTARQRARQATQEHQEKLKQRQSILTDVFSALDARDVADIAAGMAIIALKDISGTNAQIADELGLTTQGVSRLIKIAEQHQEQSTGDDSDTTDGAEAPEANTDYESNHQSANSGDSPASSPVTDSPAYS